MLRSRYQMSMKARMDDSLSRLISQFTSSVAALRRLGILPLDAAEMAKFLTPVNRGDLLNSSANRERLRQRMKTEQSKAGHEAVSFTRENLPPPDAEMQAYLDDLKIRATRLKADRPGSASQPASVRNGRVVVQTPRGQTVSVRSARLPTISTKRD